MTAPNNKEAKEQAQLTEEINEWRKKLLDAKSVNAQRKVMSDIIRCMSTGRDVSSLFTDILKLLQSKDFKLKKLVYIFLTSNAQSNSQKSLLCVNALEMDSQDKDSAIVRANAVRAMGAVATRDTAEYFISSVTRCLADTDPYVRKCAATCVSKLFKVSREQVLEQGLIAKLREGLQDGNQSVVSACAGGLMTILSELKKDEIQLYLGCKTELIFNQQEVSQLLTVLSQCTEWSALTLLQAISQYGEIPMAEEFESSLARLKPFLKHGNPSVALNTVNVILRYCRRGSSITPERILELESESLQAVLSLASQGESSEVQWIALRALRLVAATLQYPESLHRCERNIRILFPRYNDELYVKIEKLETLSMICTQNSIHEVIEELSEACKDVSQQFVKTALKSMARVACRAPDAANHVVQAYLKLLGSENNDKNFQLPYYATQELISSIQDIFRTFPGQYESIITQLCEAAGELDDPGARASLIWLLGENCTRVDSVEEILAELLGIDLEEEGEITKLPGFSEEPVEVQLQVVTALAKIMCVSPTETAKLLQNALKASVKDVTSPDVRMRFRYYERLLALEGDVSRQIIFVQKPAPLFSDGLSQKLSQQLSERLGTVQATLRELVQLHASEVEDTDELMQQFDEVVIDVQELQRMQEAAQQQQDIEKQKELDLKASEIIGEAPEKPQTIAQPVPQMQTAVPVDDIFAELFAAPSMPQPGAAGPTFVPTSQPAQPTQQLPQSPNNPAPPASTTFNPADFVQKQAPAPQPAPEPNQVENPIDDIFGDIGVSPAAQPQQQQVSTQQTGNQLLSSSIDFNDNAFDAGQCFTDQYTFAKAVEAPLRMRDPQCPIKLTVAWTRIGGCSGLLLKIRNESPQPLMGAQINLKANTFGVYALKKELLPIPALGLMNSGNWFLVPLGLNNELCNFPAAKMSQLDQNCESGFNVITFEIATHDRSVVYDYQSKMPLHCAFLETSPWHDMNRGLTDQLRANQALQQSWPQWGESSASIQLSYDQLGGGAYQDSLNKALGRLHKGNFNYITIGSECSDYTMSLQVNVGPQVKNVLLFARVWYADNAGAINFNISVRAQSTQLLAASYACQAAVQLISSK